MIPVETASNSGNKQARIRCDLPIRNESPHSIHGRRFFPASSQPKLSKVSACARYGCSCGLCQRERALYFTALTTS